MRERERTEIRADRLGEPGTPDQENLEEVRADADRMLAAGDDAIARALSQDSASFLRANRQRGGQ